MAQQDIHKPRGREVTLLSWATQMSVLASYGTVESDRRNNVFGIGGLLPLSVKQEHTLSLRKAENM